MATAIPTNDAAFALAEIATATSGRIEPAGSTARVRGVVSDSRAVRAGQLYVALRGEQHDGHKFLAQAHAQGAAAALVSDVQQAPAGLPLIVVPDTRRALGELALAHRVRWGGEVIGITGSAGKTTTKELTAAALRALGHRVLSTQGNLNNEIGLPMTLFGLAPEHDVAVVELGTGGPGEIAWLARVARPDIGVVTTVSLAHAERLGSLDGVADEKTALLRALPDSGVAIYCADSAVLVARAPSFAGRRRIAFGVDASADLRLDASTLTADLATELRYTLAGEATPRSCELQLSGAGAALDALAALAVVLGLHDESALESAAAGLCNVQALPGRMRPRSGVHGALVIDDTYNANPASMASSLRTLRELAQLRGGRAIAALADMAELGDHSQAEHERVGREVVELGLSDVFFCGPAMAHAARVAREEVRVRRAKGPHIEHVDDPLASLASLQRLIGPRDAVLVKGSRALAMERVVEALCPEPLDAVAGRDGGAP